ncbi:MAG: hypothetical protein ACTJH9_01530 [Pseudoalteromonas sp.]|uniref:hypothetical protein n=1 Tax=unclassified Pseudoalteromonas TaxID=194690 RepID=UPI003F9987F7
MADNSSLEAGKLLTLEPGSEIEFTSEQNADILILAGESLKETNSAHQVHCNGYAKYD